MVPDSFTHGSAQQRMQWFLVVCNRAICDNATPSVPKRCPKNFPTTRFPIQASSFCKRILIVLRPPASLRNAACRRSKTAECSSSAAAMGVISYRTHLACRIPNSSVSIFRKFISIKRRGSKELELHNIDFRKMDVMEMSAKDFGKFDYITAHGLFSWVPDFVREKVLSLFDELLEPNGIGYISYNAYPGAIRSRNGQVADALSHPRHRVSPRGKLKRRSRCSASCKERDRTGSLPTHPAVRISSAPIT